MKALTATRLSALLFAVLGLLIVILLGGSAFVATRLVHRATVATHAEIDAGVSADNPQRLKALQTYLQTNATGIAQTAALTAGLGQYDQAKIVSTVSGYAKKAGVTITGFDFSGASSTPGAVAAPGTFNVALGSPMPYKDFIVFLQLLEQGLMPATVTAGTISADTSSSDTDNSGVIVSTLTIKVAQ